MILIQEREFQIIIGGQLQDMGRNNALHTIKHYLFDMLLINCPTDVMY